MTDLETHRCWTNFWYKSDSKKWLFIHILNWQRNYAISVWIVLRLFFFGLNAITFSRGWIHVGDVTDDSTIKQQYSLKALSWAPHYNTNNISVTDLPLLSLGVVDRTEQHVHGFADTQEPSSRRTTAEVFRVVRRAMVVTVSQPRNKNRQINPRFK